MLNMILVLLVIVFLILLSVTIVLIINGSRKLKSYDECEGTIEELREYRTMHQKSGERSFSPIISYTVNGQKYECVGNYGSTSMKIGQKISVLYDPEEPSKTTVKAGVYVAPLITGILSLACALALIIVVIFI